LERENVTEGGYNCIMGKIITYTFIDTIRVIRKRRTSWIGNVARFGEIKNFSKKLGNIKTT
jgi:hypothetical protein